MNPGFFIPETVILLTALAVFFAVLFSAWKQLPWLLAMIGAVLSVAAAALTINQTGDAFDAGIYRIDFLSQSLKLVFSIALLLTLMLGKEHPTMRSSALAEYPLFLALATAGMMLLVSATELLTLYVALELSAFPLYILVAVHRGREVAGESAAKYMLQGMIASAITVYGISFLFGLSGTTYLAGIVEAAPALAPQPLFWFGLALTLAGFLFKLAAFPFHFWAPAAYAAAPHPVVAFIATASKVATVGALCRLAAIASGGEGAEILRHALVICAVAAMTLGNLAALRQRDLRRLLGWSAVAHAGYLLIGLQAFSHLGLAATLFYVVGYLAMGYLVFLVINEVARDRDTVPISALAGLSQRSPFLASCLLIGVFGLTGLPPTVGFIGKWFLFSSAIAEGQFLLVLIASANSAMAIYYYLMLIREAYLVPPEESAPPLRPQGMQLAAAAGAAIIVIWMGTAPNLFWRSALRASGSVRENAPAVESPAADEMSASAFPCLP